MRVTVTVPCLRSVLVARDLKPRMRLMLAADVRIEKTFARGKSTLCPISRVRICARLLFFGAWVVIYWDF